MDKKWVVVVCGLLVAFLAFTSLAYAQASPKAMMKEARAALDQAKAAGAADYAPYQYSLGETYFEFATHELDEQDLPAAEDFLKKAKDSADAAIKRTNQVKSNM